MFIFTHFSLKINSLLNLHHHFKKYVSRKLIFYTIIQKVQKTEVTNSWACFEKDLWVKSNTDLHNSQSTQVLVKHTYSLDLQILWLRVQIESLHQHNQQEHYKPMHDHCHSLVSVPSKVSLKQETKMQKT